MTDERIIAYLLEELPEEELKQFEDECFAQESWPSQVSLVEDDLIDAYLLGELTPEQRRRFEQNYLTTEARQDRVLMATVLLRHVDERLTAAQAIAAVPPPEQTWVGRLRAFWGARAWALRASVAFAVAVMIAGALWLTIPLGRSHQTLAMINLTISSSSTRAEGIQPVKVNLPLNAYALRISLKLPGQLPPAARYRVELENLDDDEGETKPLELAGQDAQSVSVLLPAAQLTRGQYALKLFAIKTDGTEQRIEGGYFFNVE
jgi:methionine-rich copper-binding protein CopC